jgi:hypothetical protein
MSMKQVSQSTTPGFASSNCLLAAARSFWNSLVLTALKESAVLRWQALAPIVSLNGRRTANNSTVVRDNQKIVRASPAVT